MGSGFSVPVPEDPDLGYVAVGISHFNEIHVIHGPPEVIKRIEDIVLEINQITDDSEDVTSETKYGVHKLKLSLWSVFNEFAGKAGATAGKLLILRLFEEMFKLGYDPVVSSDLVMRSDQATLFFRKVTEERKGWKVTCLSPGKTDNFVFVRADDEFIEIVRSAILNSWPHGIHHEEDIEAGSELLHKIRFNGHPWADWDGEESFRCRHMLLKVLGRLGEEGWRLLSGVNLKGTTDSLFFFKDEHYRIEEKDVCIVGLNNSDRVRLFGCFEMLDDVKEAIVKNGNEIQHWGEKFDSFEFKIKGNPWRCSGEEAVQSRRLICRISKTFLAKGWALVGALDVTRRVTDKNVLVFYKTSKIVTEFACISLSDSDKISLIDFPYDITQEFSSLVNQHYVPRVQEEYEQDGSCHQMKLCGAPWDSSLTHNLHARSMLLHLMKAAAERGWQVVCSADVSSKFFHQQVDRDNLLDSMDVHSWFLVNWDAGRQLYYDPTKMYTNCDVPPYTRVI